MAQSLRHPAEVEEADASDGEVTQDDHHGGRSAGADLTAVLIEGHIADPVAAVLDRPMATVGGQQVGGGGFVGRSAGDEDRPFVGGFAPSRVDHHPFDASHLGTVRKVDVAGTLGGGPDTPDLDPTMRLVNGLVLRGEKPRCRRECGCRP